MRSPSRRQAAAPRWAAAVILCAAILSPIAGQKEDDGKGSREGRRQRCPSEQKNAPLDTRASFVHPELDGVKLNYCARLGTGCGQPAADNFCRQNGFDVARLFVEWRSAVVECGSTRIINTGEICEDSDKCSGFRVITCVSDSEVSLTPPPKRGDSGNSSEPSPSPAIRIPDESNPPGGSRPGPSISLPPASPPTEQPRNESRPGRPGQSPAVAPPPAPVSSPPPPTRQARGEPLPDLPGSPAPAPVPASLPANDTQRRPNGRPFSDVQPSAPTTPVRQTEIPPVSSSDGEPSPSSLPEGNVTDRTPQVPTEGSTNITESSAEEEDFSGCKEAGETSGTAARRAACSELLVKCPPSDVAGSSGRKRSLKNLSFPGGVYMGTRTLLQVSPTPQPQDCRSVFIDACKSAASTGLEGACLALLTDGPAVAVPGCATLADVERQFSQALDDVCNVSLESLP